MSTSISATPTADGDGGGQFRSGPGYFPQVGVPAWVSLHPDVDEGALAVATFISTYRSTTSDQMPFVGRKTIARRFTRSLDWVDTRTRVLCDIGYLARIPVYRDALTGERTLDPTAADGTPNARTSNDWLFSDVPPMGDHHPHPVMSSEHEHPERIGKRIADRAKVADALGQRGGRSPAAGVRAGQTPPSDPETPGQGVAAGERLPQPLPSGPNQYQENEKPTNAREGAADDGAGSWLVGDPSGEQPPTAEESGRPGTPGARLLAGLKAADGSRVAAHGIRRHAAVVDAALEVLSSREIIDHLTGGGIRTAGGIVSRISSLADRVEVEARQRAAAAAVRNCGLCDGEGFRYHPDGRHLGPTTTRCDHRPASDEHAVRSTPPSAPQRPIEGAEEAGDATASTFRPHASDDARRRAREALAASLAARSNPKRVSL